MKEVLTKSFWQDVKKTFYEAMEPEPPKDDAAPAPSVVKDEPSSTEENQSSPSNRSEQQ